MNWFSFQVKKTPKSFLGIDVGTSSIRVVELSRKGKIMLLSNYGEIKTTSLQKAPFRTFEKDNLSLSNKDIARAIKTILKEANISIREGNFAIPDFATFFTSFELPPMTEQELPQAIKYEARSYIPLPLSEVTLDFLVIEGDVKGKSNTPLKILVAAIPNEVIFQYQEIAKLINFQIRALEAEVFALSRSINYNKEKVVGLIDIGARSTTVNILEKGILKLSHSFNLSGNELTETLCRSLKIDYEKAEDLKKEQGLIENTSSTISIKEILLPLIDLMIIEIKKIFQNFYQQENKEIEKIVLAGGTALLPGLKEYFFQELKKETEVINPFLGISYPQLLEPILKEMGPTYAIAMGLAKKGFEE